jgi:hypothetical protein
MRSFHRTRQAGLAVALAISLAVLAACSSNSSSPPSSANTASATTPSTSSTTPSGPSTSGSQADISAIKSAYESFFDGATAGSTKIGLLQNGQAFASVINAQAGGSMSKSASAKVTSVMVNSTGTQAAVKYSIYLAGQSVLPNQTGVAVKSGGKWLVGDSSFCALLALENGGKAPSVCSSAG